MKRAVLYLVAGIALGAAAMALLDRRKHPAAAGPPYALSPAGAALDQLVPRFEVEDATFDEAIKRVRQVAGVPIYLNERSLSEAEIDRGAKLSLRLHDVPLREILVALLEQQPSRSRIYYDVQANQIAIGGVYALSDSTVVRCYDIRDLIKPEPLDFAEPQPPKPVYANDGPSTPPLPADRRAEQIVNIIETCVANDSWRDNGGPFPLLLLGGRMVVTQTRANQRAIEDVLARLRSPRTQTSGDVIDSRIKTIDAREQSLRKAVPLVQIDGAPLDDAVWALRNMYDANIVVKWWTLEEAGVRKPCPVSVDLTNATLPDVLEIMFRGRNGQEPIEYAVDDTGVVWITTREDGVRFIRTQVYDVSDFVPAPGNPPPRGGWLISGSQVVAPTGDEDPSPTAADIARDLCEIVERSVDSDSWRDNGGAVGAVSVVRQSLVVTQTWDNLRKVEKLLKDLRRPRRPASPTTQSVGNTSARQK